MSRTLVLVTLLTICMGGCAVQQPVPAPVLAEEEESPAAALLRWFALEEEIGSMSKDQTVARLVAINRPESADMLFYYALLNRNLQSYGGWTQARDALQELHSYSGLSTEQKQLVDVLRTECQQRINAYLAQRDAHNRQAELEAELAASEEQKQLLEQKIQALTDLEAAISTRKEESPDAGSITPR